MFVKIKYKTWLFIATFFILFFRFFNLTANDLSTDDALYSFRALGWFDFLGGGQTVPLQWFGHIPAWANLSFHDAPPLVFAIQKIFFTFFGPTTLGARLPFALAGLGVLALFYFWLKKFRTQNFAWLATFILGISSFATWGSRTGYLEGIEVLFIILSLVFFSLYLKEGTKKNLYYFGVAVALAIMCKYTAIFLIPAALLYLLIWRREVFKKSEFWLSVVIFLSVLSPVIIYNVNVYITRGHFDAALSSMMGMHPADFSGISGRSLSFNPIRSIVTFWDTLYGTTSWPLVILMIIALGYLLIKIIRKKSDDLEKIFGVNILMLLILFIFLGFGPRFFSIGVPFLIFVVTVLIFDVSQYLKCKNYLALKILWILISLILLVEMFYNFNTNILAKPVGSSPLMYSNYRFYSSGFNELEKYLVANVFPSLPSISRPSELSQLKSDYSSRQMIFFDNTMDWFSLMWYIQKYQVYYLLPLVSISDYMQTGNTITGLKETGFSGFYFIFSTDEGVLDSTKKDLPVRKAMVDFASQLDQAGIKPVDIVSRQGITTFKVYYVKL